MGVRRGRRVAEHSNQFIGPEGRSSHVFEEEIVMATVWGLLSGEAVAAVVVAAVAAKWVSAHLRPRTEQPEHESAR